MFLEYRKCFKRHEEIQISMFLKRKMTDFPLGNRQEIEEIERVPIPFSILISELKGVGTWLVKKTGRMIKEK